jgi:uncharacterized protein (TIGR02145 family)
MKTWILTLGVFVLFFYGCKTSEIILHGDLTGFVTDAETIVPLADANVYLSPANDSTTTSDDGKYIFKGLTPGNYELHASKNGYVDSIKTVSIISANTSINDIHLTSIPVLHVSDTILDFGFDKSELTLIVSNPTLKKLKFIFEPTSKEISMIPSSGELINATDTIRVIFDRSEIAEKSIEESVTLYTLYAGGSKEIKLKIWLNILRDNYGNYYKTVKIGRQIWMAENLNSGTMINPPNPQTNNGIIEKYCYMSTCSIFGGYYQWDEAMQYAPSDTNLVGITQGVCPTGWHLPTQKEWEELKSFLGNDSGLKIMEKGTVHWKSPNSDATNETGFTAVGGGNLYLYNWADQYTGGGLWTSTREDGGYTTIVPPDFLRNNPISYFVTIMLREIGLWAPGSQRGFPVRCVKNP